MLIPLSRFFGIQETSQFKSYFSVQIYGNTKELLSWKNKCIRWLLMDAPAHVDRKLSRDQNTNIVKSGCVSWN